MEIARLAEWGEPSNVLDERVQATYAALKASSREDGVEQGIQCGCE